MNNAELQPGYLLIQGKIDKLEQEISDYEFQVSELNLLIQFEETEGIPGAKRRVMEWEAQKNKNWEMINEAKNDLSGHERTLREAKTELRQVEKKLNDARKALGKEIKRLQAFVDHFEAAVISGVPPELAGLQAESKTKGINTKTILIIAGAVVVVAVVTYLILKKK